MMDLSFDSPAHPRWFRRSFTKHGLPAAALVAAAVLLHPAIAQAEPAVLYVPTVDVTLQPVGSPGCPGNTENSAAGCTNVVNANVVVPPYGGDMPSLMMGLMVGLDPYDVHITNVRPPDYLHYTMLIPSDVDDLGSANFTCTTGNISCAANPRSRVALTSGSTVNCTNPDVLHASLFAFGRASGLEGVDNPADAMGYLPNYMLPVTGYVDACSPRVNPLGLDGMGNQIMLPLECTSADHTLCPDGPNGDAGQNSHADLLSYYQARVIDIDPPQLANVQPFDGQVFASGDPVILDVDITDADPVVGARWILTSPFLAANGFPDGVSVCTNDVCTVNWNDATPLKATASDWSFDFVGLPDDDYELTLEVSDYHGNEAQPISLVFQVGGMGGGSESGSTTGEPGGSSDGSSDDDGTSTTTSGAASSDGLGGSSGGSGSGTSRGGSSSSSGLPPQGTSDDTQGGGVTSDGVTTGSGPGNPPNDTTDGIDDPSAGSTGVEGASSTGSGGVDTDGGGCSCRSTRRGAPPWMLLPLLWGAGAVRRRRR